MAVRRHHMNLKILLGTIALGLSTVSRDQWEAAAGDSQRLTGCMIAHKAALKCTVASILYSDTFNVKHSSMQRFIDALVSLPGSKWKVVSRDNMSRDNLPRGVINLNHLSDVSKMLRQLRLTAKRGLQAANFNRGG